MFTEPWTQWAAVTVFTVLGALSLWRAGSAPRRLVETVGHLFHTLMAIGMIAMAGPWWPVVSPNLQLVVFILASAWFAALAALRATRAAGSRTPDWHGVWHLLGHAVMMLAMVWMVAAMMPGQPNGISSDGTHHHHHQLPISFGVSGVAITAALVVTGVLAAVEFGEQVRDGGRRWGPPANDLAGEAAMSLAMAAMCWAMVA